MADAPSRISFAMTRKHQASNDPARHTESNLLAPSPIPTVVPTDLRTKASKAPSSERGPEVRLERQAAFRSTTVKADEQQRSSYGDRVKDHVACSLNISQHSRSLKRTHSPPAARALPSEHSGTLPAPNSAPPVQKSSMTEPPAKRAKRTDSSAMWDRNSPRPREEEERGSREDGRVQRERDNRRNRRDVEKDTRDNAKDRRDAPRREGRERDHDKDIERRQRSRSRERKERKRERSRSRDREARYKNERRRERSRDVHRRRDDDGQSRRDHGRARSRDRYRSREEPSSRRSERPRTHSRSRSRSPIRDKISGARTRSPLRPSKPNGAKSPMPDPDAKTFIPSIAPPTGPRSQKPATTASKVSSTTPTSPKPNGTPPTTGPSVSASKPPSLTAQSKAADVMDIDEDPETAEMRKMMGFAGFKSTKQTKVPGNNVYCVRKEKKTEYRQYMNRLGGFNRPLSPSR